MDEIMKQAKHLGELIISSKEFISFENAKAEIDDKGLLNEIAIYENAVSIIENGNIKKDSKLFLDANEIVEKYKNNEQIKRYFDSKKKLNFLLDSVNQALAHSTGITGGVSAGCGGCTGCPKRG